nr:hypothetical protein CFP56_16526 [Quercus suber]
MNRYRPGGPSKATPTTLCQKCLKKGWFLARPPPTQCADSNYDSGHYSYECTSAQQERPYTSRPSRTQQLLNPKLAPKITEVEQTPPKMALARHDRGSRNVDDRQPREKQQRSASVYSSDSVSTISTDESRTRSRTASSTKRRTRLSYSPRPTANRRLTTASRSRSPGVDRPRRRRSRTRSQSHSPVHCAGKGYRERGVDDTIRPSDRAEQLKSFSQSEQMSRKGLRSPSPFSARRAMTRTMELRQ